MSPSKNPGYLKELRAARRAAREAGRFLMSQFGKRDTLAVESKSWESDYVTRVDRESEARIRSILSRAFPGDGFLGEEGGARKGSATRRWIIDPLDGTTNYLHGFPMFAVSIGLEEDGDLKVGVVFDPSRRERFEGVRGQGATLNGRPIAVSGRRVFRHALSATGFPFREFSRMNRYLTIFETMARSTAGIRRPGSASLDLCYLACGRVDLFWEFGLGPWDVAAGALIIQEAGGRVTDMNGGKKILEGDVAASNGPLHRRLLQIIQKGTRP